MPDARRAKRLTEVLSALGVMASLLYVAYEIRLNTSAIQATSAQAAYEMHQENLHLYLANPQVADLRTRARLDPASLSPSDSVSWTMILNLEVNIYEMVHTAAESGAMTHEMAEGWLDGLEEWICRPGVWEWWAEARSGWVQPFVNRVDRTAEEAGCASVDS
jgi:hypothetical protein